jgi:hypothetical protein
MVDFMVPNKLAKLSRVFFDSFDTRILWVLTHKANGPFPRSRKNAIEARTFPLLHKLMRYVHLAFR